MIATSTNLIQRQGLSIVEREKAYKALLDAKSCQGHRSDMEEIISGESRQKYSARALVAEFFGVSEYEIRKAIKLALLIPQFQDIMETAPKRLNLSCAELMADYDAQSQEAFVEICSIEGYQINKATMQYIVCRCPPSTSERQAMRDNDCSNNRHICSSLSKFFASDLHQCLQRKDRAVLTVYGLP